MRETKKNRPIEIPKDTVLYQYIFLGVSLEKEDKPVSYVEDLSSLLCDAINISNEWAGLVEKTDQLTANMFFESISQDDDHVVYPFEGEVKWGKNGTSPLASYVYALVRDETLAIQLAYSIDGEASKDYWGKHQSGLWQPSGNRPYYFGTTVCYGAVLESEQDAFREAENLLGSPVRLVRVPFGGWLFDRPGLSDTLAIFYPREVEGEASEFFNEVLPELSISAHKVAHQFGRVYQGLLKERLEINERELATILHESRKSYQNFSVLESQLNELAYKYGSFAALASQFERLRASVGTNSANFFETFEAYSLPNEGPFGAWRAAITHSTEQMDVDDRFIHASRSESEISLRVLQLQADIKRGKIQEQEKRGEGQQNLIIAVIGTLIALWHVVEQEDGEAILRGIISLFGSPPEHFSQFAILGTRLVVAILATVALAVIWSLIVIVFRKRRARTTNPYSKT